MDGSLVAAGKGRPDRGVGKGEEGHGGSVSEGAVRDGKGEGT